MNTKTKLILKGVDPDDYSLGSEDNPDIISKLEHIAAEMGVVI